MKTGKMPQRFVTRLNSLVFVGVFIILAAVVAVPFYTARSSSLPNGASQASVAPRALASDIGARRAATTVDPWSSRLANLGEGSILPSTFGLVDPPLATYASDCTTPKSTFNLGDVVCAKVSALNLAFSRSFSWVDPSGFGRQVTPITDPNQSDSYTLPGTQTTTIGGVFVVDNRGTWKVNVVSTRGVVLSQTFNVEGATPSADLSLVKLMNGSSPDSGADFTYTIALTNFGPNDATNVQLSDPQPANATYVSGSATQVSGPSFSCTGSNPVVCTPTAASGTLAVGATAIFQLTYTAGSAGSTVTNIATVTSDTAELNETDNTANSGRITINDNGTPPTCTLDCPNDITVATNANQGGPGAIVTFGAADTFGTCGAQTASPVSGSFFAVGTHPVTVSAAGGGSCTFNVTVIDVASPTISCPANQSALAPSGQSEASVAVGSPTATGDTITVTASRSDQRDESDPYPIGVTTIVWTATDQFGRIASCTQTVTVTSADAPTISCPADRTFAANAGDCSRTLTAGDIGTPTTGGLSGTLTSLRSDGQDLTDPYPAGQTVITWTFTNAVGNVSCNETITITTTGDTVPPTLTIPPDLDVTTATCSALLDDELGVATATDNCTPAIIIVRTGIPQISCPIPGNPTRMCDSFVFPVGTTNVTYSATDASGNTATGVQHVTVHELTPPTFTFVPGNVTVNTGAGATTCGAFVGDATLGTATISDNCDTTVIRTGVPAGNIFPVGSTTITYTARADLSVQRTQIVTVVDDTLPVVTAPGPVTLYTGPSATSCGVTVTDLNGTFGTGTATDNCPGVGPVTRGGVPAGGVFPVGQTTLTYSATDAHGNTGSADQVITVVDNTPPVIVLNGQTPSMWPPNHKYQTFGVTNFVTGVTDNCGTIAVSSVVITKVTSDELENSTGDGNTFNDIVIAADCKSVQLRSERNGGGNGRVYTIYFQVVDSHGNVGTASAKVIVQHNPGETAIDSGAHYTVLSNCQ
jgi:uncharacterized repeat protein (TIGR01451 family)